MIGSEIVVGRMVPTSSGRSELTRQVRSQEQMKRMLNKSSLVKLGVIKAR